MDKYGLTLKVNDENTVAFRAFTLFSDVEMRSRTKSITPILTCESRLFQPWNFHMWSRENFNMQIRLKLCQIWRVEKFHTLKFQAWNFHT